MSFFALSSLLTGITLTVLGLFLFLQARRDERLLTSLLSLLFVTTPALLILLAAQQAYFGTVNYQFTMMVLALLAVVILVDSRLKREAQQVIARLLSRACSDRYARLSAFSRTLVASLDLGTLSQQIVRTLAETMGTQTAALYLLDKEQGAYRPASQQGIPPKPAASASLRPGDPLPLCLERQRRIIVRRATDRPMPEAPTRPGLTALAIEALDELAVEACIPLLSKDQLIGFCALGSRAKDLRYSEEDLDLLSVLAQNAAAALDNAILYENLRRSQELRQRADRLRSLETAAGGLAHEIRNPLTSIKTFVQLGPELRGDPALIGHFTSVATQDLSRIERLVSEMLDYARVREPHLHPEDLNAVVASCLSLLEAKASSLAVKVEQDLAPDLPLVPIDLPRIRQVLLNLFLNALEAMDERGGRLAVKTERLPRFPGDERVLIEISDTGRGIPAEELDLIFTPFYATKPRGGDQVGVGLGLTPVQQIVQDHGGSIEVESAPGQGTTVVITLPAGLPLRTETGTIEDNQEGLHEAPDMPAEPETARRAGEPRFQASAQSMTARPRVDGA